MSTTSMPSTRIELAVLFWLFFPMLSGLMFQLGGSRRWKLVGRMTPGWSSLLRSLLLILVIVALLFVIFHNLSMMVTRIRDPCCLRELGRWRGGVVDSRWIAGGRAVWGEIMVSPKQALEV